MRISSRICQAYSSIGTDSCLEFIHLLVFKIQGDTKKRELLKNPTKIEEIQEKKIIDRN